MGEIFANHTSGEGLSSNVYKELQLMNKKGKNLIKKWTKELKT